MGAEVLGTLKAVDGVVGNHGRRTAPAQAIEAGLQRADAIDNRRCLAQRDAFHRDAMPQPRETLAQLDMPTAQGPERQAQKNVHLLTFFGLGRPVHVQAGFLLT